MLKNCGSQPYITFILLTTTLLAISVATISADNSIGNGLPTPAELSLQKAEELFENYEFSDAAKELTTTRKKDKNGGLEADIENLEQRIRLGEQLLNHVEKIIILDSISVPVEDFFTTYRIPSSAGRILAPENIPLVEAVDLASMAYSNEAGDFLMWSQPDSIDVLRIVESSRLTDGKWTAPMYTPEILNGSGDADYPFLSNDGSMLYFSADREDSLGGYDIFVASRNPSDGSYLAPRNLGMPFNSPADDFLLVLDEENGVGWWATDRNHIPGHLTIYLYKIPEERDNIPENMDAVAYAKITDFRSSQPRNADFSGLLDKIRTIGTKDAEDADFRLPMPHGHFYTKYEDFQSQEAATKMHEYIEIYTTQEADLNQLATMRRKYAHNRTDKTLINKIIELEKGTEERAENLSVLLSEIYRIELSSH